MATKVLITLLLCGYLQRDASPEKPVRENINLPGFEAGDLFLLDMQPNERLVNLERSEWVYVAILIREGLDVSVRKEALADLAKLRKTDELTQILDAINRAAQNEDKQTGALDDLIGFLMATPAAELKTRQDALLQLSASGDHSLLRRAGYAAMMIADGTVDNAWRLAETSEDGLVDLLAAVPIVTDPNLRAALYPKVEPLLRKAPGPNDQKSRIRESAILAIASIPGHEKEVFATLASLVKNGPVRDTAIEALDRLASHRWPKGEVQSLADSVIKHMQGVNPIERNSPDFRRARRLAERLAPLLRADHSQRVRDVLRSLRIQVVVLRAIPLVMKYDKVHFVVKAAQPIEITFENPDTMLHNLVIVMPGALAEVGIAASQMLEDSENWKGRSYVPNFEKVLYATGMVRGGQSETLRFIAPETIGEYPFLCTYPGHWVPMNGILHVVDNVDAWIAANPIKATGVDPQARDFVQAWTMADLVSSLPNLSSDRSLEQGKELFTTATCAVCHQVQQVGGVLGPELGEVTTRLKPADMLAEILEPSKTINEEYRTWMINLDDGRMLSGVISKQDEEAIYFVQNPLASTKPIKILRDQIEDQRSSAVSTMPMGLLNTLTREEILDLLAYIRSGVNTGE